MDEDKFGLVEKILKDIDNVMSKNTDLYAFEIVPVDINFQNKSPVLHLENCLGLESWCIKHVFKYCYSEIMDQYFPKPKRKGLKITSLNSERLTRLLNVTLLLNPDLTSLWNKRREMLLKSFLDKSSELKYTKLVLSRKPKCNDAFAYRRWLLEVLLKDDDLGSNYIESLATEELSICDLASDQSPNNYHSWNHRLWLINILKTVRRQFNLYSLYIKEYNASEKWISRHISDFSCFHYRQLCIKNIFNIDNDSWIASENCNSLNFRESLLTVLSANFPNDTTIQVSKKDLLSYSVDNLIDLLLNYANKTCKCVDKALICRKLDFYFHEMILNNELQRFYKHHETLWYHRRFIVHEILLLMYEYFGFTRLNGVLLRNLCQNCSSNELRQKQPKIVRYDSNQIYTCVLFKVLLSHEKKFIEEMQSENDNYAIRHEKYLKFVEGLNSIM